MDTNKGRENQILFYFLNLLFFNKYYLIFLKKELLNEKI